MQKKIEKKTQEIIKESERETRKLSRALGKVNIVKSLNAILRLLKGLL